MREINLKTPFHFCLKKFSRLIKKTKHSKINEKKMKNILNIDKSSKKKKTRTSLSIHLSLSLAILKS